MSDVTRLTMPQVGGAAMTTQAVKPNLQPTAAETATVIVGALRVMLPPGDATERLLLTVGALPEQARQEVEVHVKRCATCGKPFAGKHPAARYCSDRCGTLARMRQYRLRRGDGQA